jgi:hypothetical protein
MTERRKKELADSYELLLRGRCSRCYRLAKDEHSAGVAKSAFVLIIVGGNAPAGRPPAATLHETRADAETELLDYVRRNWDDETDGAEQPEDPSEMVERYFEEVTERYEIVHAEVKAKV